MRPAVLAVIAALASAGRGAAEEPIDLNAALAKRILRADSARVVRLREPLSTEICFPGDDHLDDFIPVRGGRADGEWRGGMAEALASAMRRYPSAEICRRGRGPRRIQFGVQFLHGDSRTTFVVYLSERCVEFWSRRTFEGSAALGDHFPRVLALLKQAFPADTTVRRLGPSGLIPCEDYVREHPGHIEQPAEATRRVPPDYPKQARKEKIEGEVMVEAMVGVDGTVGETRVLWTVPASVPALEVAAVAAVRQWRFEPALDCWGQPVTTRLSIPVRFSLP